MAEETKKDKAIGWAGTAADLAGLATIIGTSIPGLKKAKKRDTSQRAARAGATRTSAAAVGGSQTGFGATRGLALREGLRAASGAARASADAASTAAAQDEQRFVQERDARSARLAEFGKGMGDMAANVAGGIVDVKAMRAAEAEEAGVMPEVAEAMGEEAQAAEAEEMQELGYEEQQVGPGPTLNQTDQYGEAQAGPTMFDAPPVTAQDAYRQAMGLPSHPVLSLAPQLEQKLRLQNLVVQEADRMGIPTTSILAQALRQANIPSDLGDIAPGYEGEHADTMSMFDDGAE